MVVLHSFVCTALLFVGITRFYTQAKFLTCLKITFFYLFFQRPPNWWKTFVWPSNSCTTWTSHTEILNQKTCSTPEKVKRLLLIKGALPHLISKCIYRIALYFQRAYVGWPYQDLQNTMQCACKNRMWQLGLKMRCNKLLSIVNATLVMHGIGYYVG